MSHNPYDVTAYLNECRERARLLERVYNGRLVRGDTPWGRIPPMRFHGVGGLFRYQEPWVEFERLSDGEVVSLPISHISLLEDAEEVPA